MCIQYSDAIIEFNNYASDSYHMRPIFCKSFKWLPWAQKSPKIHLLTFEALKSPELGLRC